MRSKTKNSPKEKNRYPCKDSGLKSEKAHFPATTIKNKLMKVKPQNINVSGVLQKSKSGALRIAENIKYLRKNTIRFLTNELVAKIINAAYDSYSRFYEGQLRLGLPVSPELIKTQREIRHIAAGKLALTLYHIILRVTGIRVPRSKIKNILIADLECGKIRLTENVIILTKKQLKELVSRFEIPGVFFAEIYEEAARRRILKETLREKRLPAYFESIIEESTENGRGDYEIVFYRDYTEQGKEIKFRRLVSIEGVTSGDTRPSVILVPGFANNSNCYDLTNQQSLAKDLADKNCWVYLFDPRGMGINEGHFDPFYTVDTLIDYDLPTVLHHTYKRSRGKPAILIGHSMGGIISEFMVLLWNLRLHINEIQDLTPEQRVLLNRVLPSPQKAAEYLKEVRGIITLGSPKFFDKESHLIYPSVLWLNHLSRILRLRNVPVKDLLLFFMQFPIISDLMHRIVMTNIGDLNFLICPENQSFSKEFTRWYIDKVVESVPLGLGFQFLKAIYNGQGFKRMDETRFNYSTHLGVFPDSIPVVHFWGSKDPLAPPANTKYSALYPHRIKRMFHIESPGDIDKIKITDEPSQLIDIVIEGANHLDLLYGRLAEEIVNPLLFRIIEDFWGDWNYNENGQNRGQQTGAQVIPLDSSKIGTKKSGKD